MIDVLARRYLCVHCGAVLVVVPREMLPRRHYSAPAIALALTLWGAFQQPPREVRRRVGRWPIVGPCRPGRWATLRRWAKAVRVGALFPGVRPSPATWSLRDVARRAATTIGAHGPPSIGAGLEVQAFLGAACMA